MEAEGVHSSPSGKPSSRAASIPTVSVIMPSLNSAPYIRTAIDSALGQTHAVLEVIVVDGGSKDGTRELVASYGDPVRLVDQSNTGHKGIAGGRNVGVEHASGDWLAFLDADDWWEAGKIAEQMSALEKSSSAVLSYTGVCLVTEPSGERRISTARAAEEIWPSLRWNNDVANSTVLARRTALVEAGGFREDLASCEDWELWVRLRLRYPFVCCPAPLTFYRVIANSTSHGLQRHLDAIPQVCESTMVAGLSGWQRWVVRRRLWAAQLYGAALIARENGDSQAKSLLWRSLAHWPLPTLLPIRYKVMIQTLVRGIRARS
jgi:glycosyltransferase involved in cell wall biosynthesis